MRFLDGSRSGIPADSLSERTIDVYPAREFLLEKYRQEMIRGRPDLTGDHLVRHLDYAMGPFQAFLDKAQPGDRLHDYANCCGPVMGSAGQIILRGDRVVAVHQEFIS